MPEPLESDTDGVLDTLAAAALAGRIRRSAGGSEVSPAAWRGMARRSGIQPDIVFGRTPGWLPSTVRRILATAPGRGMRTDLKRAPRDLTAAHIHGIPAPSVLTLAALAEWLGVRESTVRHWSYNGSGPRRRRAGARVEFLAADVEAWLTDRLSRRPRCPVTLAIVAKHPSLRALVGPVLAAPRRST